MEVRRGLSATVIRTAHRGVQALTAMRDGRFDRRLGGVRFVRHGSAEEVVHLAEGMSDKCAASRVPVNGQKTLVICPDGIPGSPQERAELLGAHMREVIETQPDGIFGPDMACGSDVLDLIARDPMLGGHVTGLSRAAGGIDINGEALTALGLAHALAEFRRLDGTTIGSAVVQGFGMVGAPLAVALADAGLSIRAVSTVRGALIADEGLDIPLLHRLWRAEGDGCLEAYSRAVASATLTQDPDALLRVRADVFVPAARTTVLAMREQLTECRGENPNVQSVEDFMEASACRVVLEGANHPLTHEAERFLEARGVAILPDVLVNIGGMVGCHAEWRARQVPAEDRPSREELLDVCRAYTNRVVEQNVALLFAATGDCRAAAERIIQENRTSMLREIS